MHNFVVRGKNVEEMDSSRILLRMEVVPTGVHNTSSHQANTFIEFISPGKHAQMLIEFTKKKFPFPMNLDHFLSKILHH